MTETIHLEPSLKALETIVKHLEQGDLALEDALKEYEKGIALARTCQKLLTDAEKTIAKLNKSAPLSGSIDE